MTGPRHRPAADIASRRVPPRDGRRTLLLILAVGIAPVVASYAAYYLFHNEAKANYGVLLPTAKAPAIEGSRTDGTPFRLADLRGRWVLLATGGSRCDAACERGLHAMRQARTMQGNEQGRIARVWLVDDNAAPAKALLERYPGLVVALVAAEAAAALPAGAGSIYLIDPLGNLVLRYTDDPDIMGVSRDLARLLKASRIG